MELATSSCTSARPDARCPRGSALGRPATRWKRSKTCGSSSAGCRRPCRAPSAPLALPTGRSVTAISPSNVNLNAFDSRLRTIFSTCRGRRRPARRAARSRRRARARRCSTAERNTLARSAVSCGEVGRLVAALRRGPASMREKSSSVLTSLSSRRPFRCTTASGSRSLRRSASVGARAASSSGPSMRVSGVRNSWLTLLKNAVFGAVELGKRFGAACAALARRRARSRSRSDTRSADQRRGSRDSGRSSARCRLTPITRKPTPAYLTHEREHRRARSGAGAWHPGERIRIGRGLAGRALPARSDCGGRAASGVRSTSGAATASRESPVTSTSRATAVRTSSIGRYSRRERHVRPAVLGQDRPRRRTHTALVPTRAGPAAELASVASRRSPERRGRSSRSRCRTRRPRGRSRRARDRRRRRSRSPRAIPVSLEVEARGRCAQKASPVSRSRPRTAARATSQTSLPTLPRWHARARAGCLAPKHRPVGVVVERDEVWTPQNRTSLGLEGSKDAHRAERRPLGPLGHGPGGVRDQSSERMRSLHLTATGEPLRRHWLRPAVSGPCPSPSSSMRGRRTRSGARRC